MIGEREGQGECGWRTTKHARASPEPGVRRMTRGPVRVRHTFIACAASCPAHVEAREPNAGGGGRLIPARVKADSFWGFQSRSESEFSEGEQEVRHAARDCTSSGL